MIENIANSINIFDKRQEDLLINLIYDKYKETAPIMIKYLLVDLGLKFLKETEMTVEDIGKFLEEFRGQ